MQALNLGAYVFGYYTWRFCRRITWAVIPQACAPTFQYLARRPGWTLVGNVRCVTSILCQLHLVAIGQRVTFDLAPLAINAGYAICFEPGSEYVPIMGDDLSLSHAVTNLVQKAIEHGGRRGTITVHVDRFGTITVSDEGAGIPIDQRERIFEPFHRLQSRPAAPDWA